MPWRALLVLGFLAGAVLPPSAAAADAPVLAVAAPGAFSPNGDGVEDGATMTVGVDRAVLLSVDIVAADGSVVAALVTGIPVEAGETSLRWQGTSDSGSRAPDGVYTVVARAADEAGSVGEARAQFRLDTTPPGFAWLGVPERVGGGPLRLRFRAADGGETVRASLVLSDRSGAAWTAGAPHTVATGAGVASWALRASGGGRLAPGAYRVALRVVDEAGNGRTSTRRPILVRYRVTSRLYRRLDGAGSRVALTFDDCNEGDAWTRILDVLEARGLKASFFCLGPEVAQHPAQARRTLREGHTIGNHTWRHRYLPALSFGAVRDEVVRADTPWWRLARAAPLPYFRPPYGAYDATAVAAAGDAGYRRTVLWDVDPQDWRRPGAAAIADRAVGPARAGSIILLHVIAQTADALPSIVGRLRAKGLRPVSLDELFRAAGVR